MAVVLDKIPQNITEYPNSFKRQGAFPLDAYSVFVSIEEATEYAIGNRAYAGQPIAVYENDNQVIYYIIGKNSNLIRLGTHAEISAIDLRLKSVEKFFETEEGESLKDTLDELFELQKWIETHLKDFEEAKTEINEAIEAEKKTREEEDGKLSESINKEIERATGKEGQLQEAARVFSEQTNKTFLEVDAKIQGLGTKINELDVSQIGEERHYVKTIKQEDGLISASIERLPQHYEEEQGASETIDDVFSKHINYIDGDTFVIKKLIASDKYSYTAYIRESNQWKAMDGNYNANNIYFDKDLILAGNYTRIGNVTKSSNAATKTLDAKGKTLADLFSLIFTEELYPVSGANRDFPTIVLQGDADTSGEVGSEYALPTVQVKISDVGSYTYGPETGIKFTAGNVTLSQGAINSSNTVKNQEDMVKNSVLSLTASDSNNLYTDEVKTYTFNAEGIYTTGAVPTTNLGKGLDNNDDYESWSYRIPSGKAVATPKIVKRTGYRCMFAGGTTAELTSEIIRGFSAKANSKPNSEASSLNFVAEQGSTKIVCAFPGNWTGTPYVEMYGLSWGENSKFALKNSTILVADARGSNQDGTLNGAIDYKIYIWELEEPLKAEETKFRIWFK